MKISFSSLEMGQELAVSAEELMANQMEELYADGGVMLAPQSIQALRFHTVSALNMSSRLTSGGWEPGQTPPERLASTLRGCLAWKQRGW